MSISLLIYDAVVASPGSNKLIERGYVYVDKGLVRSIGEGEPPAELEAANLVVGGSGRVVLPGLVTAHTHLLLYPLRHVLEHGDPANTELAAKLVEVASEREAYLLATLSLYELTLQGATIIQASDVHAHAVWRAMRDAGVEGVVGVLVGCRYSSSSWREELEMLIEAGARVALVVCKSSFMDEALRAAKKHGLRVYAHPPDIGGDAVFHATSGVSARTRVYVPLPGGSPPETPLALGLDAVSISSVLRAAMIAAWQGLGYENALLAATSWGAEALGLDGGVIEPGKPAHLVVYDVSMPPGLPPRRDTLPRLLLDIEPRVELVVSKGAPIVDQGEHITIPRSRVEEAARIASRLLDELKPA